MMTKTLGLYLHIPFCRSKCPYCDFFSYCPKQGDTQDYVNALCHSIADWGEKLKERVVDTVYIGGGTPSVLTSQQLHSVLKSVTDCFNTQLREVTVECNPSDVSERLLCTLLDSGVNRLSMGMQSAVESERKALGRRAGAQQVISAVETAQRCGFENISLDLMLGIPGQTADSLSESLRVCSSLAVQHVSAYILKVEEGTPFDRRRDSLCLPDDDCTADLYLQAVKDLRTAGFEQYEISNFAKTGFESLHNLKYWCLCDYLGIGPGAHSFLEGRRFFYPRNTLDFVSGCAVVADSTGGDDRERVMLSLRLSKGLNLYDISDDRYRAQVAEKLEALVPHGLVYRTDAGYRLSEKGFLVSNSVIGSLM